MSLRAQDLADNPNSDSSVDPKRNDNVVMGFLDIRKAHFIRIRHWNYIGHVLRMDENKTPTTNLNVEVELIWS